MDELDFQILRILDRNGRIPYSEVARHLNISVRNIIRHVDNMLKLNIIECFRINFNYDRLGLRQHIAFIQPPKDKESINFFENLQCIPEIERIWMQLDGGYTFTIFSKDAKHLEDINVELLKIGAILTGRSEVRMHLPSNIPFSLLDWRLIYYLFNNGRAVITNIASDLGVSEKTISRRLKRFENMKLVQFSPIINFEEITGMVTGIASFETFGPSKEVYQLIKKDDSIKYWRIAGSISPSIVLFLYGKNISEVYTMYSKVTSREDIKRGKLSIIVKNWDNSSLIKDTILEKIQG